MPVLDTVLTRLRTISYKDPKVLSILALSFLIIAGLLALLLIKKPFTPKAPTVVPTAQISITKNGFMPATLSVKKGTKVTWINSDTTLRQIQANPHPTGDSLPELKSEILNNTQTYEYTFSKSGTFNYHDHINPAVNGIVKVE